MLVMSSVVAASCPSVLMGDFGVVLCQSGYFCSRLLEQSPPCVSPRLDVLACGDAHLGSLRNDTASVTQHSTAVPLPAAQPCVAGL